jgi:fused signal recognition particle receptor
MFDRFKRLREGVQRSRDSFFGRVSGLFERNQIDDALWDDLEELLLEADMGADATEKLLTRVKDGVKRERIKNPADARRVLEEEMVSLLKSANGASLNLIPGQLNVILVVGVNGTGKTTTIAKLAGYLKDRGHKVMLAAADTFRAAAIDQLKIWGDRASVPVISHQPGADPGAVAYDAYQAGRARGATAVIVDTAGRLHTRTNLMEELKKVSRVLSKLEGGAPREVLLVLDATTGQNALTQARSFMEAVGVTGIVLAKLDGTAKGGVAFAIVDELKLPIKFVGTGETLEDLAEFDAATFVSALLK